eukprot:TRINITY_DN4964_c0_g1_i2.p1 TRINITY_DN4964_c0_g1~~TRINITY_DN4964_c0_g1_i2.p1  ORF type:complete len:184 (+),score=18.34 TRINITY_DN4964_c0_g1_i2:174-725(+)
MTDEEELDLHEYSNPQFWDERYRRDPEPFEWYQQYSGLKHILTKHIPKPSRILMVGCGNSGLSFDMIKDGYSEVVNIDISAIVIEEMRKRHPNMIFEVQNVCNLPYEDKSFDAAIDKGTLDALLCGNNSVKNAEMMLANISRTLKPGGTFIMITYGKPDTRKRYLDKPHFCWNIQIETVGKCQ